MNHTAQGIRAKPWHIYLLSKKCFISCSVGLVFFSLTFMYTFKTPVQRGIYRTFDNATIVKAIYPESQFLFTLERNSQLIKQPKRVNVIIISFPRSGSSFLGDIFNQHPGVFYLFEPVRTVQRNFTGNSLFEFNFSSSSYQNRVFEFFEDITNCRFASEIFIRYLLKQDRFHSLALTSPPFCLKNGTSMVCHQLESHQLEDVCKNNHSVFAAKILTPRILNSHGEWTNGKLLQRCLSGSASECKIIHLVRDPRAVVESLKSLKFFRRPHDPIRELSWFVKAICHQMEYDVKIGNLMRTSFPDGYKLIRFEDLAQNPLLVANELFKFAGLEMLDTIKEWLHVKTKSQNGDGGAYSTSRDSKKVISNWRTKMSAENLKIVEKYCGSVMRQLEYINLF